MSDTNPDESGPRLPDLYIQLRALAQARLAQERPDHTLQPTALVHEAWLRLQNAGEREWRDAAQFFAAAADTMRQVLIDHARARSAQKRGGDAQRRPPRKFSLEAFELAAAEGGDDFLAVDEAISRLRLQDAELARLVDMRFYVGMTEAQTAEALAISPRTVRRNWQIAKAWLRRELSA